MDTRYRPPDSEGEHAELVRPLRKAFSSLRLFADSNNPLPTERLIAHARREADNYRCWEESGAPVSGLVVRLNDREEVGIIKPNSRIMTIPYSRAESPPGSVLKVYKKADDQFSEVLLYAIEVDSIPPDGLTFRKTYPNRQSLFLHIEPEEGEQLKVSVNYTPVHELAREASPEWVSAAPAIKLTLLTLPRSLYLIYLKLWRDKARRFQASREGVFALANFHFLTFAWQKYSQTPLFVVVLTILMIGIAPLAIILNKNSVEYSKSVLKKSLSETPQH